MPKHFKRTRSFKKKGTRKLIRTRRSTGSASGGLTKFTSLSFKGAKLTQQPLPDRYFTWLTVVQDGVLPTGAASANLFAHALNDVVFPFNKSLSLSKVPGALTSNATLEPTGLRSLLYDSAAGNSTGIYKYFRVWMVEEEIYWGPQNAADDLHAAMAPVMDSSTPFGAFSTLQQGPGSKVVTCNSGGSPSMNRLHNTYSIPALAGIPPQLYSADTASVGTYSTTPAAARYLEFGYLLTDGGVSLANIAMRLKIKFHVEFFGRQDASLPIT